ncbi:androglobin-like isoform X19 [Ruditapes philippinarum]|uniref:androglobin-like isoform X19 n=1 Tax=Ruditapes philippinarum TaxID=129788 RepID=UPI00295C349E|nr:androglobin-like isoform X19 [Ruditapes philippinarum]
MSWAKLASNSRSTALTDSNSTDTPSGTGSRRDSNVSSAGSNSSVKNMFKRLSLGKAVNSDSSEKSSDSSWKSVKRMSLSVESRNSDRRPSDGSVGSEQNQEGGTDRVLDRANRKMSLAFKKLGKAQFGLASILSAASIAQSASDKRPKLVIWPEWNDVDVNAEKWGVNQQDMAHKGKEKDKGKSPVVSHSFDDPEGKIEMPPGMRVDHWKRPQDYITEKTPVVIDPDGMSSFNLITNNEHLHESELMRYIISQIMALWEICAVKNPPQDQMPADPGVPYEEVSHTWKPWEHIYTMNKVQKGPHIPPYNPYGKYAVRLYWMGCWRKIIVDDTLPFDENDRLMLPCTTMQNEVWPMLLTKALIKVAALDYTGGNPSCEFGDVSIVSCLTGWLPEAIPLQGFLLDDQGTNQSKLHLKKPTSGRASPLVTAGQVLDKFISLSNQPSRENSAIKPRKKIGVNDDLRYGHISEVWELLRGVLPEFKLPLQEWQKALLEEEKAKRDETASVDGTKEEKSDKDSASKDGKVEKPDGKPAGKDGGKEKGAKDAKEKEKGKDGKDKKGDKDKDKKGENLDFGSKRGQSRLGSSRKAIGSRLDVDNEEKTLDETPIPENPEVVIFASYRTTPKYPVKISVLGENADASERLRQNGLSHMYPHPVLITQTRACPLEPPPPPEKIPAWKTIRPRKKKTTPSDEPVADPEPPKPIQCLEITSPFVNYKVSPVPIPTDTHRPKSALERGGTRSRPGTGHVTSIEETDENAPEPETVKEPPKEEHVEELTPVEVVEEKPLTPSKGTKSARKSAGKKETEASPKAERKMSSKAGSAKEKERSKSISKPGSREGKREEAGTPKPEKQAEAKPAPPSAQTTKLEPPGSGDQAGGLAVPPENGEGDGSVHEEETAEKEPVQEEITKPTKKWMDFDQFCRCFKTLYIYHKPNTYPCSVKHSDLKKLEFKYHPHQSVAPQPPAPTKGDKKSAPNASGVNTSPSKTVQTPSHTFTSAMASPTTNPLLHNSPQGAAQGTYDDKAPYYLFVDNLQPTEIVVSFSSLSRWPEPPPAPVEEKKSHTSLKGAKDKIDDKEMTNVTSSSVLEGSIASEKAAPPNVTPGTLVAEPYSWKSLVTGQPILRLKTSAIRAAVLCLPAGRHVLKFMMSGPLGYHVHLCSSTQFVFGDEETVMAQLTKESCIFVDNANQVITCIGKCINAFGDQEEFVKAWKELTLAHCPYQNDKQMSKQNHFKVFSEALYTTLRKVLRDIASPEIAFAWRAFMFDATSKNILSIPAGSRPATGHTSHRGSAKPAATKGAKQTVAQPEEQPEKTSSSWENRQATTEEQVATVKLQKQWKGYWVRKIRAARTPGSEENQKVLQNLQKCWAIIEQNLDPNNPDHPGLFLFRQMFKIEPDLMVKYPFYKDEWNKISYNDYKGQFPDQPPNNWFVVFREVFHVMEEMLAVPKLYVPISTCMLRVINNDTGEEIPRVFQKVAPYVYKKNRKGYTFVAEARTTDQPLQTGTWRMRMIGSLSPLPAPLRGEVNSSFSVKEIKDYYLPNSKNVIFRYAVKVTEDHLTSIQMNTSKSDVHIKLVVLNNEEEVASTLGKGHAVIPAFTFLKDINPDEEPKRSTSRASNKGDSKAKKGGKRGGSGKSNDGRGSTPTPTSRSPRRSSQIDHHSDGGLSDGDLEERDLRPHKYIVEAQVLKDSWPLSESSWNFVQMLKEMEKNELKVAFKEKPVEEPAKTEKAPAAADKGAKGGKGGKGGKDKGKDKDGKGSRPPSQQFDLGKPHWTLRVVSDANAVEDIEIKKDTERADEIRALKKAWEDAEPGRAAKAMQSRLKYLSTHTIKLNDDEEEGEKVEGEGGDQPGYVPPQTPGSFLGDDDGNLTLEPPPPPTPKEMLQPVDITPFLRHTTDSPRYLDEEETQRRFQEQQKQIAEYKAFRQQVEEWRKKDKELRNMTKEKQIQECEELQAMLDAARESINKPREAFRQTYLEAERKKLEELEAKEAALQADAAAKSPKGKKGSAKGKKSPSAKKKK